MSPVERVYRGLGLAVLPLVLAGCHTPPAVYDLAETTSANAAVFQQHLGDLASASKALAADRADLVVSMESFNAQLDSFIKREIYMRQQSNKQADWSRIDALMKKLAALRDEIIKIEQAARIAEQSRRKEILGRRIELDTYATAMREAANALNALSQRESSEERARFIGRFVRDVNEDVRTALKESDKTSEAANKLVDKVKSELKGAGASDSQKSSQ